METISLAKWLVGSKWVPQYVRITSKFVLTFSMHFSSSFWANSIGAATREMIVVGVRFCFFPAIVLYLSTPLMIWGLIVFSYWGSVMFFWFFIDPWSSESISWFPSCKSRRELYNSHKPFGHLNSIQMLLMK